MDDIHGGGAILTDQDLLDAAQANMCAGRWDAAVVQLESLAARERAAAAPGRVSTTHSPPSEDLRLALALVMTLLGLVLVLLAVPA